MRWQWHQLDHMQSFAPRSRRITTPAPHHSILYQPDALPDAQTVSKHWRQYQNQHKLSQKLFSTQQFTRQHSSLLVHVPPWAPVSMPITTLDLRNLDSTQQQIPPEILDVGGESSPCQGWHRWWSSHLEHQSQPWVLDGCSWAARHQTRPCSTAPQSLTATPPHKLSQHYYWVQHGLQEFLHLKEIIQFTCMRRAPGTILWLDDTYYVMIQSVWQKNEDTETHKCLFSGLTLSVWKRDLMMENSCTGSLTSLPLAVSWRMKKQWGQWVFLSRLGQCSELSSVLWRATNELLPQSTVRTIFPLSLATSYYQLKHTKLIIRYGTGVGEPAYNVPSLGSPVVD